MCLLMPALAASFLKANFKTETRLNENGSVFDAATFLNDNAVEKSVRRRQPTPPENSDNKPNENGSGNDARKKDTNRDGNKNNNKSDAMLDADDIWGVSGYDGDTYVYIGGKPIGIVVNAGGLIVLGTSAVSTDNGNINPLAEAGLQRGDILIKINSEPQVSLYLLKKALNENKTVKLTFQRGNSTFDVSVSPVVEKHTGEKKIGLIAKEDIGGVGTLTFVTGDGKFAALGHHIADPDSGLNNQLNKGNIYNTKIEKVIKGEKGKAGGLCAGVSRTQKPIGRISKNTDIGIYGDYDAEINTAKVRVAARGEAKMGRAQILTTINGDTPKFYDIDIVKIVTQTESAEKGMVIAVRDEELLEKTGGIVQGMSGSPIVQNGALIGAVTHVFISDPTRGYAVHSRFMLEEAETVKTMLLEDLYAA